VGADPAGRGADELSGHKSLIVPRTIGYITVGGLDVAPNYPVRVSMQEYGKRLAIVVPVYKKSLNLLEQFSIDYLVAKISNRKIYFIGPRSLDRTYYDTRYTSVGFMEFDDGYFSSIIGYNHLLLAPDFYQTFSDFDYLLLHQTDALVFHDNLDYWMARGFDYIGAPWPDGVEIKLRVGKYAAGDGVTLKAFVGNGGFSLRSIRGSIMVLEECADVRAYWLTSGSSEDLFFAFAGMLSDAFIIPNQLTASRFSMELTPRNYYQMNHDEIPTGAHAWWKHDLEFWKMIIARVG